MSSGDKLEFKKKMDFTYFLTKQQMTKMLIRLCAYADLTVALLFPYNYKQCSHHMALNEFSYDNYDKL